MPFGTTLHPIEEHARALHRTLAGASPLANPIDSFLGHEHERHGLTPRPEAPRHVLLRRVYLDLVGLPRTLKAIDAGPRGLTSSSNGDLAFGGIRGYQSSYLVDGADNNNGFFAQARGRVVFAIGECAASTTIAGQRQLFLPAKG